MAGNADEALCRRMIWLRKISSATDSTLVRVSGALREPKHTRSLGYGHQMRNKAGRKQLKTRTSDDYVLAACTTHKTQAKIRNTKWRDISQEDVEEEIKFKIRSMKELVREAETQVKNISIEGQDR